MQNEEEKKNDIFSKMLIRIIIISVPDILYKVFSTWYVDMQQ